MEFLHEDIHREYERWAKLVGTDDPYTGRHTMGLHEVLRAYFLIADFFAENEYGIGGIGPRSVDLLHSAIYRQFVSFDGKEKWSSPYEKCATLMFGLVKDHPFHDANKRTALLAGLAQLDKCNRTPTASQKQLEDFVVEIADNQLSKYARYKALAKAEGDAEVLFIADFLKRNSREIDKRHYTVTYHQLNRLLQRYGYELRNPSGNYIDVVRVEWKPRYLGIVGPRVRHEYRIGQIGFPGWKRQVNQSALKTVRKATGLTVENGYDSAVFYGNADPLEALIDIYSEPLRRLASR
jgi:death-on-curing family protein